MNSRQRIQSAKIICLTGYSGLLISLALGQVLKADFNWLLLLLQSFPLLLCLPGMIEGRGKAFVWLGCLLLFYCAKFFSDLIVTRGHWMCVLQTLLALITFATALLYVRWLGLQRKEDLPDAP